MNGATIQNAGRINVGDEEEVLTRPKDRVLGAIRTARRLRRGGAHKQPSDQQTDDRSERHPRSQGAEVRALGFASCRRVELERDDDPADTDQESGERRGPRGHSQGRCGGARLGARTETECERGSRASRTTGRHGGQRRDQDHGKARTGQHAHPISRRRWPQLEGVGRREEGREGAADEEHGNDGC